MLTKPLLGAVGLLVIACGLLYISNQSLRIDLQTAIIKKEAAETSLKTAEDKALLVETQLEQFSAKVNSMQKERDEARAEVNKMRNLFQDHDFAYLLKKKTGLVENLMIKRTQEVFDEVEALTAD